MHTQEASWRPTTGCSVAVSCCRSSANCRLLQFGEIDQEGIEMSSTTSTQRVVLTWSTRLITVNQSAGEAARRGPDGAGATLPLITRSGFEQRHIFTSQIAAA